MADYVSNRNALIRALIQKDKDMIKAALGFEKPKKFLVLYHEDDKIYYNKNLALGLQSGKDIEEEISEKEVKELVQRLDIEFNLMVINVKYEVIK
jgi:hypothetical protein